MVNNKTMNKKYKILRCGDQYSWAYHNVAKEHNLYSIYDIGYAKYNETYYDDIDLLYIHSPDITTSHASIIPLIAKDKGIKVIGGYAGNPKYWKITEKKLYSYANLIVTISPQTYKFAKDNYNDIPVIFLPESIDTHFFYPSQSNQDKFEIGWAGGIHKKIKRAYLLDKLDFPVIKQSEWGHQYFDKERTLDHMRRFYHSVDVLLVTSLSECMPRTVLEAMACGLPVIATDVGSIRLLLDKEWIVPALPEKELIKQMNLKLKKLKENPELREEVGRRNLKHVRRFFSWKNNAILWDNVFSSIIKGNQEEAIRLSKYFLYPFMTEFNKEVEKTESFIVPKQQKNYDKNKF